LSGVLLEDLSGSRVQSIDVDEYHRVNDERYKYFKTDLPTSALIVVKRLAHEDLIVEIECVAVIPTERFKPTNSNDYGTLAPARF
jgi:enamine deaminase RidA (YjgF/YER057c/UK114 family)